MTATAPARGSRGHRLGPTCKAVTAAIQSLIGQLRDPAVLVVRAAARKESTVSQGSHHLAQLNIGALRAPLDSPEIKDFVDNLDRINALAESSPGFVWRLVGEGNDATSLRPLGENVIVNLSVWKDADSLREYVYKSAHVEIMKRRREWFSRMGNAYLAMWWVPRGHTPTLSEAVARLEHLRQHGPTLEAFTFGEAFSAPDAAAGARFSFKDSCPA